jgi:hypothetical protein
VQNRNSKLEGEKRKKKEKKMKKKCVECVSKRATDLPLSKVEFEVYKSNNGYNKLMAKTVYSRLHCPPSPQVKT